MSNPRWLLTWIVAAAITLRRLAGIREILAHAGYAPP